MKRKNLLFIIVILSLFFLGSTVDARPPVSVKGMGLPPMKWWRMPQVAEKMAFTEEEKEKLDALYLEHRQRLIDLRGQLAKERLGIEELLDTRDFDSDASMEQFKKVMEATQKIATERFSFLIKVREILGLERFQLLKGEFRKIRMDRKQGRARPSQRDRRSG